ncbi:MAG TPA: 50S ribosomal protein L18Ae [Patescibacteria group bacterium]|nr:50S ribosomal protein L18Ae [Patescibacteria group bacterium]
MIKIFRVSGRIDKPLLFEPIIFKKEVSAAKESHALEKIYAEMGSRHRAKRHQIVILGVEEVEGAEEGAQG